MKGNDLGSPTVWDTQQAWIEVSYGFISRAEKKGLICSDIGKLLLPAKITAYFLLKIQVCSF